MSTETFTELVKAFGPEKFIPFLTAAAPWILGIVGLAVTVGLVKRGIRRAQNNITKAV